MQRTVFFLYYIRSIYRTVIRQFGQIANLRCINCVYIFATYQQVINYATTVIMLRCVSTAFNIPTSPRSSFQRPVYSTFSYLRQTDRQTFYSTDTLIVVQNDVLYNVHDSDNSSIETNRKRERKRIEQMKKKATQNRLTLKKGFDW